MTAQQRSIIETMHPDLPLYVVAKEGGKFEKYTPAKAGYPIRIYPNGVVFDDFYSREEPRNRFDDQTMFNIRTMLEMNVEEGGTA